MNENSSENSKGVLLTKWEAEFPVNVASYFIFENIYGNKIEEKSYFEFSDKLYSKCKTLLGKKAIKRQIKNMGYEFSDTLEIDNAKYEGMTYYELFPFVNAYYNKKSEIIIKKQLYNKIYIILSIVSLFSAIIVFAFLFTTDIRRSHNPIREYAVFDKNGDSYIYSKVEVDFLTEYRCLYPSNDEYKEGIIYGEYYIYGNFLQSSTEPEKVNTLLNEIIEISMTILSLLCMLVYVAALVFAKKSIITYV